MSFELGGESRPLIVVHAQHPLVDGKYPSEEFAARLSTAVELYGDNPSALIYTPGSRHRSGSHHDDISLSQAGTDFLQGQGVSSEALHGDDWNEQFKPDRGVYNAGDEVYVAARAHKELALDGIRAVCAHGQKRRLALHYAAYNLSPSFSMPATQEDVHDSLSETVLTAYTRLINPTWQIGIVPRLIRASRLPRD